VLVYKIEHDELGETTLEIRLRPGGKDVFLDGNAVKRLGEILGIFPTITFSSQDIQILRGTPSLRRRVMDLMFVVMDPEYYGNLQRYYQALKSRNSLLKQNAPASQMQPFEHILIEEGRALTERRKSLLNSFVHHFRTAYCGISQVEEQPEVVLIPSVHYDHPDAYEEHFYARLKRDQEAGSTSIGPHRDDLGIRLQGHAARDFASEGQQRGLVLAMRLGLVDWYRERGGTTPVILADDIVGELDSGRRRGFWEMLGSKCQIFATGTQFPVEDTFHEWTRWTMDNGSLAAFDKGNPS
jgi:DNA replication and repair protein RecF